MKVTTTECLKIGSSEMLPAGTVFTDADGDLPHYILDLIKSGSTAISISGEVKPQKAVTPKAEPKKSATAKTSNKKSIPTETDRPKPTPKPRRRKSTTGK